ncbi:hypothetical protein ACMFMG_006815 [Clarireedia jacksonii]
MLGNTPSIHVYSMCVSTDVCLDDEADTPYNWMIILGGTNDLNQYRDVETIFEYLIKEWRFALSRGTQVLALTVPECGACDPTLNAPRDHLNNLILSYKAENL